MAHNYHYGAVSQNVVAYFGTYTVDEPSHVVTLHIEQSSFPNWNGTDQQRKYSFTDDELRCPTPIPPSR